MTRPIYNPAELESFATNAEALGIPLAEAIAQFERIWGDHTAILIAMPGSRPVTLDPLPVNSRLMMLMLLQILDELLPLHPEILQPITDRAHLAGQFFAQVARPNDDVGDVCNTVSVHGSQPQEASDRQMTEETRTNRHGSHTGRDREGQGT
ncbi:hypothetical protein [Microbacterium sp. CJ88]|uniref:hypothetical protein n=1 Tax=Microbacterium sp. CJ88 TaxID=3445672 RepID=UPI003F660AA3